MIAEKETSMKILSFDGWIVLILSVSLSVLSGCATSSHPRFYLLSSLDTTSSEVKLLAEERCYSIGIGPIRIPDYLDRPQIVTRGPLNEISLAELDRWGEPLKDNVIRVLAKNLSTLLCTDKIAFFPWRGGIPIDYRIEMEVLRLDGSLGEKVSLEAWWMVLSGNGKKMLLAKKSNFTEAADGQDYKSLVTAHGRALGRLSQDIAEAIKTLSR